MKKTVIVLIYLLLISISVFSKNLIDVASGLYHTLLLFDDGKILAVGNNFYGQLGIGSAELERSKNTLHYVDSKLKFISVAAGDHHSLAVADDGTLWGWGSNADWQLSKALPGGIDYSKNAQGEFFSIPMQINSKKNWKKVYADGNLSFALKKDGTLWNIVENFEEIKNPNNKRWKNININTTPFLGAVYNHVILEDADNKFWIMAGSNQFSCFSLLQNKDDPKIFSEDFTEVLLLDVPDAIHDLGATSYSGAYKQNKYITLWGSSIVDIETVMEKYHSAVDIENFFIWLFNTRQRIENKNCQKLITGSFYSDICFFSEIISKAWDKEKYVPQNGAYTVSFQTDRNIVLWTNGRKYENPSSIKIKNIFGKYNLIAQSEKDDLYVIGYNYDEALGYLKGSYNTASIKYNFLFLEPIEIYKEKTSNRVR